jgi:O-acetyl-ADP-ribose deacetylase (regulator of RNase III)
MPTESAQNPPRWSIVVGNAAVASADLLICPANVFLTMSGGVGGEILIRFGDAMQRELQTWLTGRGLKFVQRGEITETSGCGSSFRVVLHAVAVDGLYQSSEVVVADLISRCMAQASVLGVETVVLTALATGYGRLTMREFAAAIRPFVGKEFGSVRSVSLYVRHPRDKSEIEAVVPTLSER